jgi:MFS family permease
VALWGEGSCFLLNSFSFLAVIAALFAMRIAVVERKEREFSIFGHLRDGFSYVAANSSIKFLLITTAVTSLASVPYMVLMPVYVKTVFHGTAQLLGYMMAASAVGALLGTLILASRKSVHGLGKWLIASLFALSASLLVFSFSSLLLVSIMAIALGGFGSVMQMAASNTILQTIVDDDKRGRVASLFGMAFLGFIPLGGLVAGFLADHFGCPAVTVLCGLLALVMGFIAMAVMPRLRREAKSTCIPPV